jgi:hypothetical protein
VYQQKFLAQREAYEKYVAEHGAGLPASKKTGFPLSRVKAICKADKAVGKLSQDAVQYMALAAQEFVRMVVGNAAQNTAKKQLTEKELLEVLVRKEQLWFLRGVVCKKAKKDKDKDKEAGRKDRGHEKGQRTLI